MAKNIKSLQNYTVNNGCWEYTGYCDIDGYPRIRTNKVDGKSTQYRGNRLAFWVANGYFPEVVLHTCDNPSCINPKHLKAGTWLDNALDREAKGRGNKGKNLSKLTQEQKLHILHSKFDNQTLAEKYGVTHYAIARVRQKAAV